MQGKCFVSVAVRGPSADSPTTETELGEFRSVWEEGVTIGSDPRCTVVLPELAPVAVRVVAASNHKLLFRLPEGTTMPLPPVTRPVGGFGSRVDYREFPLEPYWIRFGEVYRDA
jgi:hypothetical protein